MTFYFFTPNTPNESIFELVKAKEVPKTSLFDRYYLDSDTVIERREGKTFLKGNGQQKQIVEDIAGCFLSTVKLHFQGTKYEMKENILFDLVLPWKTKVLVSNGPIDGLIPYNKPLTSYFFQRSIGIFAGPGTGKTCLARALSNHISIQMGISCDNSYEYATTHIARYGPPTFEDQTQIFFTQWEREQDIRNTKQITISDCPHPLSVLYAIRLYQEEGRTNPRTLLWLQNKAAAGLDLFDTKIYLPPNKDRCKKDGIRLHEFDESTKIGERIKLYLEENNCDYIVYDPGESMESLVRSIFYLNSICTEE